LWFNYSSGPAPSGWRYRSGCTTPPPAAVPFLPWQPEPWFFGLFTNSNIFGSFCAMLIPLGLVTGGLYFLRRDAMPGAFPIPFLAVGLLCFSIYAARSLGAAIAAGAAVFILLVPGKRFTIPLLLLALALFGQQAAGSLNQPSRKSLESRVQFNRLGLHALVRMPVAGSGLGTMALGRGPIFRNLPGPGSSTNCTMTGWNWRPPRD